MTAVLGGISRPDCKRKSVEYSFTRSISKIDAYFCRQKAIALSSSYNDQNKRIINNLNKLAKLLENASSKPVFPLSLSMDLECHLCQIGVFEKNKENKGIVNEDIIQSKFQADLILVYCFKNYHSYSILLTDADFQVFAGPSSVML